MSVVKTITKSRGTHGSAASKGERKYGFDLLVVTDDLNDGPETVGNALGFSVFDTYNFGNDSDPYARLKEIGITRSSASPYIWEVTLDFDTNVEDWDENPLARPTVIDYDFQPYERVATTDVATGKPIVNAAGMPFDPPIMVEDSRLVISFERNELVFPLSTAVAYQNATNSDAWFGLSPNQAKMLITGKFSKEGGYEFYAMRYEAHVRWETWTQQVLNVGLTNKDGSPCTEKDGETAVSEPAPLSTAGTQLSWPIDPTEINFLPFTVLNSLPFTALGLP